MREITFYRTSSGKCSVEEFLDSLTGKQVQKIVWVLKLIEELDVIPEQYLKKLVNTNDIWEIRISLGNDIFRLLGFWSGNQIILTNGFAKKTQKTPPQEIALAEQRKKNYLIREKDQ